IEAARTHGRTFFTTPGLGSLYFWAGLEPPTSLNDTTWMLILTPSQQARVVADLQKVPELCWIRWPWIIQFRAGNRDFSNNKVARYLEENFVLAESVASCDILVRRRPGERNGAGRGKASDR